MSERDIEREIERSWTLNADAWAEAVRSDSIRSRVTVTNAAIVNAIADYAPRSVLDVGCGEGWLLRQLSRYQLQGFGIDGSEPLIALAQQRGGGEYRHLSYRQLAQGDWPIRVDLVVFNFSLLGETDVAAVLAAVPGLLQDNGRCLIQTLHPTFCDYGSQYISGWRKGSWKGFGDAFSEPAPWYFRTLADWLRLFESSGLTLEKVREPSLPDALSPSSIIFDLAPVAPQKEWQNE